MTVQIIKKKNLSEYRSSPFEFSDIGYIKSSNFLTIWSSRALDVSPHKTAYICIMVINISIL